MWPTGSSIFTAAFRVFSCGIWLPDGGSSLGPCIGSGALATGPPGKSLAAATESLLWVSNPQGETWDEVRQMRNDWWNEEGPSRLGGEVRKGGSSWGGGARGQEGTLLTGLRSQRSNRCFQGSRKFLYLQIIYFILKKYLFIWQNWVLVAAHSIFSCSIRSLAP